MNLAQQVQSLIDGAPDIESQMTVAAIAPVLQRVAAILPRMVYYVPQSLQGEWVITTLQHRQQVDREMRVIYAFSSDRDIIKFDDSLARIGSAIELPIIYLLFELLAIPEIDRVIFLNDSQQLDVGQEISRAELEESIAKHIQELSTPPSLPPNVC